MSTTLPFEIIRNESSVLDVYLRDEDDLPIDLTSLSEVLAEVPDATPPGLVSISYTGTEISVEGNAVLGHLKLKFPAAKTALMGLTNYDAETNPVYTTLQLKVTITGNPAFAPNIIKIAGALNVIDPIS